MKVLAIVPSIYDTSPGQRFRIEQWEPILKDKGVEITYSPFETEELHRVLYENGKTLQKAKTVLQNMNNRRVEMRSVQNFDLVYVFREAAIFGPALFEKQVARSGVPMIFDFDDAVFVAYKSPSNGYLSHLKFPKKTGAICRHSAWVMAGNDYLADYARQFNPNVTIVPTTIDTDKYQPKTEYEKEKLVIGWSGSYSTAQYLDTVAAVFQDLAKERDFVLKVIGAPKYNLDKVNLNAIPWKSATEVEDLLEMDIGIMPMPDDLWSQGKCGLKALQYMALGIPTICSPIGVNRKIIKDGANGFLAADKDEWIEKLKRLMDSVELRRKLGREGRKTVEQEYSAKVIAPQVFDIFNSVVKKGKYLSQTATV
jgi:glycosyltransferase involved in cell wall biosynthesis